IGPISSLVIQALRDIGRDRLSDDEQTKVILRLKEEDARNIRHDMALAPEWIKSIMKMALNE
ncbi:MAG: hypothetical protein RIB86_07140, partial [Imperialibacter sp.]